MILGTKLGPWLFIVMIDDLQVPSASGVVKYVVIQPFTRLSIKTYLVSPRPL